MTTPPAIPDRCRCGGAFTHGICYECGRTRDPEDQSDRIRSPDDVPPRIVRSLEKAASDERLSPFVLEVFKLISTRGIELRSVYVLASSRWVADELAAHKTQAVRALKRLAALGYIERVPPDRVKTKRIRRIIDARRAERLRPPNVYEIRREPHQLPSCAWCSRTIADAQRVSRVYCSEKCRKKAQRQRENRGVATSP